MILILYSKGISYCIIIKFLVIYLCDILLFIRFCSESNASAIENNRIPIKKERLFCHSHICLLTRVTLRVTLVIRSFNHKGLKEFFETGSKKGILPEHAPKLARILDRLDSSTSALDMNLPGYRLHQLKGDKQIMWSVTVNGNWRVLFYFKDKDAYLVDYLDYH